MSQSKIAITRRDVTRALDIAKALHLTAEPSQAVALAELIRILEDIDARTGKRDPSTRKRKGTTEPVKKAAKR